MLTTGRDGSILVEESGSDTIALFDTELNLIEWGPTRTDPIDGVFATDGAQAFIGHSGDTVVTVFDAGTLAEVARVEVSQATVTLGSRTAIASPSPSSSIRARRR